MANLHNHSSADTATLSEQIEIACEAFAKATGYYAQFHRGLSSESSDRMRKGMRAALVALEDAIPNEPQAVPRTHDVVSHPDGSWHCETCGERGSPPVTRPHGGGK